MEMVSCLPDFSSPKVGALQIGFGKVSALQIGFGKVSALQIGPATEGALQIGFGAGSPFVDNGGADLRPVFERFQGNTPTAGYFPVISRDGFSITPKCRAYLEPLIKGEDYPPDKNGMPQYVTLKKVMVPKKLDTDFKV